MKPLAYGTMIIVQSAKVAATLLPHVEGNCYITWPGDALTALKFSRIVNLVQPQDYYGNPRTRDWYDTVARTRLAPNGEFCGDPLDVPPLQS